MFANTKKQTLINHSISVGLLSKTLFEKFVKEEDYNNFLDKIDFPNKKKFSYKKILNSVFISGLFHDIGKIDDNFQNYINEKLSINDTDQEFDFQIEKLKKNKIDIFQYPLHNEISFAIISSLLNSNYFSEISNNIDEKIVNNIIYFHHAKIQRDKKIDFSSSTKILKSENFNEEKFFKDSKEFIFSVNETLKKYNLYHLNLNDNFDEIELEDIIDKNIAIPVFQSNEVKTENELFKNAITHLLRSIIVSADRLISKESAEFIEQIMEDNDYDCFHFEEEIDFLNDIDSMLDLFNVKYGNSERSIEQSRVAREISEVENVAVLKGPAGVGKTKIMFEWLKNINNKKRTFIIVPKTSIALSLYEEIRNEYLINSKVEIVIGDLKETSRQKEKWLTSDNDIFSGDVIITTIDQILNMMLGHSKIDVFLEVLNSNLIFDEFHEFLYIPGISMLFIEIIYLKNFLNNKNCLLVSATPNYFLLKKLLISEKNVKKIKSFNETKYKINLIEFEDGKSNDRILNEMFEPKPIGEVCIFNTATKAQQSAMQCINQGEKNTLVFHSKFDINTRRNIFSKIMKEFGKKGQTRNYVLRVGPILQASVDISTKHMHTEISNIDNIYQRLGRVVRWGESNDSNGEYSIYIPDNFKTTGSVRSGLVHVNCINATEKFADFIKSKIDKNKRYTLNELYDFYDEFFVENKKEINEAYQLDFDEIVKKSEMVFSQNFEPIKIIAKKINKKEKVLPKKSLRNRSIFCFVLDYVVEEGNKYTIIEPKNISDNLISMSRSDFYGGENFNKYLEESRDQIANNMGKYKTLEEINKNIKETSYLAKKNISKMPPNWFENLARSELIPLVLSFKEKTKKLDFEEQYFNVIYKGVHLGLIKKDAIK